MRFLLGNPLLIEEFGTVDVLIYGDFLHSVLDNSITVRGNSTYAEVYKGGSLVGRRTTENDITPENLLFEPIKGFKVFLGLNNDLLELDNFRLAFYLGVPLIIIFSDQINIDKEDTFSKFWPIAQDNFSVVVICSKAGSDFFYSVYTPMELTSDKSGVVCTLQPHYYFEFNFSILNQLKRKDPVYLKMKSKEYLRFLKKHFT